MEKLLDFCRVSGKRLEKFEGKKKYIATGDIIDNKIKSYELVSFENRPSRANQEVRIGDVLFAKMKDTVKVIQINEENVNNIYSTVFFVVTPNENVRSEYLYWLFNSKNFNKEKDKNCKGATQQALNLENLSKIYINKLPSYEEQEIIINQLEKVQKIIDLRKKQIEELDELIKSHFLKMFGDIKNNKWNNDKLGNITLKITDGKHGGCERKENSGYYFVGATEIYDNKINYELANQITEKDFKKDYSRCDLKIDDFVIVNTGATIGKSAIVDDNICYNILLQKSVALIRVNKLHILPIYLKYCYDCNPSLYSKGQGCARVNLLLSQIRNTIIPVPPMEMQNQFEKFVKQIDLQKFIIEKSLKEIENLQESFMNKYF